MKNFLPNDTETDLSYGEATNIAIDTDYVYATGLHSSNGIKYLAIFTLNITTMFVKEINGIA